MILKHVQEPEGCRLPCLWGFVPSQSEMESARAFAAQFGSGYMRQNDIGLGAHDFGDIGSVEISYPVNDTRIIIHWAYYRGDEATRVQWLSMGAFAMERFGVDPISQLDELSPVYGDPHFNEALKDYLLSSILTNYGPPTQVMLAVQPDDLEFPDTSWYRFSLALVYREQGVYVEYVMTRETVGDHYVGCPDKSSFRLAVWDPGRSPSLTEIMEIAGTEVRPDNFRLLEEATLLTLAEFYAAFKNPDEMACVETPIGVWPGQ